MSNDRVTGTHLVDLGEAWKISVKWDETMWTGFVSGRGSVAGFCELDGKFRTHKKTEKFLTSWPNTDFSRRGLDVFVIHFSTVGVLAF